MFIPLRGVGTSMLTAVIDRTGRADIEDVRSAFDRVERGLAAHRLRVQWPVSLEIVLMPIMGATKSAKKQHTLFVSLDAVRSNALDGLLAHEMGHMIRTETRHPSHDLAVFESIGKEVRIPRKGLRPLADAFSHVQDIYADDLAFLTGFDDRAHEFFSTWIEGNCRTQSKDRWTNVDRSVSNGFCLGNLQRHGLLEAADPLRERARRFDRRAGFEAVDRFALFFASLPQEPTSAVVVERVKSLADSMARAADSRSF